MSYIIPLTLVAIIIPILLINLPSLLIAWFKFKSPDIPKNHFVITDLQLDIEYQGDDSAVVEAKYLLRNNSVKELSEAHYYCENNVSIKSIKDTDGNNLEFEMPKFRRLGVVKLKKAIPAGCTVELFSVSTIRGRKSDKFKFSAEDVWATSKAYWYPSFITANRYTAALTITVPNNYEAHSFTAAKEVINCEMTRKYTYEGTISESPSIAIGKYFSIDLNVKDIDAAVLLPEDIDKKDVSQTAIYYIAKTLDLYQKFMGHSSDKKIRIVVYDRHNGKKLYSGSPDRDLIFFNRNLFIDDIDINHAGVKLSADEGRFLVITHELMHRYFPVEMNGEPWTLEGVGNFMPLLLSKNNIILKQDTFEKYKKFYEHMRSKINSNSSFAKYYWGSSLGLLKLEEQVGAEVMLKSFSSLRNLFLDNNKAIITIDDLRKQIIESDHNDINNLEQILDEIRQ